MDTSTTIRTFTEFFRDRGHQLIGSSSLVPPGRDPVMFTTAGMHPLTSYLEGEPHPLGRRLAGVQRCLRTTDLDEVGDNRHLTVFQMLGSWSLGDYGGRPSSTRSSRTSGRSIRRATVTRPTRRRRSNLPCDFTATRWRPSMGRCADYASKTQPRCYAMLRRFPWLRPDARTSPAFS